uniref:PARP catalytic domain-containing protein n=1 Tax=Leptobrachium leishanense TaxID=445787 RepID=A0A8C5MUS1_9ANUR
MWSIVVHCGGNQPKDGKIYVMYHGTTVAAAQEIIKKGFRQSSADGMLGRGVYVSRDQDKAARYPLDNKSDQVILKLRVNVGRVKKIDYQGHPMQKTWHDHGYDTAWVPAFIGMVKSELEEDCVWDPKRIKVQPPPHLSQGIDLQPTDGNIYVMYHGTTLAAAIQIIMNGFHRSADGMLGRGVYVSRDQDKAERFPLEDKRDQVILKLRVNVGKVIKIDRQDHPMQKTWHDHGNDTAWVPEYCGMVESGLEEDCVWDPKRIKVVGIEKAPHGYLGKLKELVKICKR